MKCAVDGQNAKIIAKAILSLSKFSTDLFIEADQNGLKLRSVNVTQSAIGTFKFHRNLFESFEVERGSENYCKVSMKACLTVFRNMKQVEHCEMCILAEQAKFQVKLRCRLETIRNAIISIVEEENISAPILPDNMMNSISASHKIFTEMSNNFNTVEEEITLEAYKENVTVKNYIEGSRVNDKFMRSQLKLGSTEFDNYKIQQESTVTFCLKEFRAFLHFAENINENIDLNFDEAGSPLCLLIKKNYINCILIMSTVSPDEVSFYEGCQQSEVMERSVILPNKKRKLNNEAIDSATRKHIADDTTLSNDTSLFRFNGITKSGNTCSNSMSVGVARNLQSDGVSDVAKNIALPTIATSTSVPTASIVNPSEVFVTYFDTEENRDHNSTDDEHIPQSPPRQRGFQLRNIFSRCFEMTYVPKAPSPNSLVYVPDSDTED